MYQYGCYAIGTSAVIGGKNPASCARTGSILGYLIAAPICFFTATCGMLAKASGADLGDGTSAFAYAIKTFTSPFFGGIIFAFVTMIIAATRLSSLHTALE